MENDGCLGALPGPGRQLARPSWERQPSVSLALNAEPRPGPFRAQKGLLSLQAEDGEGPLDQESGLVLNLPF